MLTVVIFILAICTVFIIADEPIIGIAFTAMLALLWHLKRKIADLTKRIQKLEWAPEHIAEQMLQQTPQQTPVTPTPDEEQIETVSETVEQELTSPQPETAPATMPLDTGEYKPLIIETIEDAIIKKTPEEIEKTPDEIEQQAEIPAPPVQPKAPSFIDKLIKAGWNWFTDGNIFVRVGIVILFMGMTFLIRYAITENIIPIELRLVAVSAVAIGLMVWGWLQREKKPGFALVVQGGGIGLLYLTIFAGFSLYDVIPSTLAFILLALTVILAAVLAVLQDAKSIALFASIGGFMAPILTSSGSNNYIGLFSYYTILNIGIFAIAWFKSWRILNFVGFIFTFAISAIWGVLSYKDIYFSTTEPFLIIFFLLYVAIGILFAHKRTPFYKDYVDSSLIFGTPLLAFGMQTAIVHIFEYGIAISAALLAVFYLLLANVLWKKFGERLRLLSETFVSLGVIFATLAIPFAIDGSLTAATWAIEGAGILWISIKQQQKYRRLFGIALVFAAGVMLVSELFLPIAALRPVFDYPFANSAFIGCVIIAISASCSCWLVSTEYDDKFSFERVLTYPLLCYSLLVLLLGFEYQIFDFDLYRQHGSLLAVLSAVSIVAYTVAAGKLQWHWGHWTGVGFILPLVTAAILAYAYQHQLAAYYGYLVWPLSIIAYFYALRWATDNVTAKFLLAAHILISIVIVTLLLWEGLWQLLLGYSLLTIAFNYLGDRLSWPQLKSCALIFLPVLIITSIGAIKIDGNLVDLSAIAGGGSWPFPAGNILWPFGFAVYFFLLYRNQQVEERITKGLHYAGAGLIAAMLLWLGLWPLLLGSSLLAMLCCYLWQKFCWAEMRITAMALLPLMVLTAVIKWVGIDSGNSDPFHLQSFNINFETSFELGYLLWPLGFIALFWSYRQFEKNNQAPTGLLHSVGILLLAALITTEASWHILDYVEFRNVWHLAWLPIPALATLWLIMKQRFWPFSSYHQSFLQFAVIPLSLFLIIWSLIQLTSSGLSAPLPWLPLINPLDILQAIIVMAALRWSARLFSQFETQPPQTILRNLLLAFIFLWANVELLRAIHHWKNIAWQMPGIVTADISQTSLSLFWALCGLLVTQYATRKTNRMLWIYGAVLLGVVVLKLFIIDLAAQETIERIISFTGVGLLLTAVGYYCPIPPRKVEVTGDSNA